jgi:hypothetical protein
VITVDRFCAAVCLNGHVLEDCLNPWPMPNLMGVPRFCDQCGTRVLRACETCGEPLLGAHKLGLFFLRRPKPFCPDCGAAYPWATREERVGKLYDLIDHEDLDEATLLAVQEQIAVLSTPVGEETDERRGRALERLKGLVPRVYEATLPVLQNVATAEMKRRLKVE